MFIRAKSVKGKKYAYLVENTWKKGKVKQVVKKYVGKIISLPESTNYFEPEIDFSLPLKSVLQRILAAEFLSRGFTQGRGEVYKFEDISLNLTKGSIKQDEKSVVLFLNGRYLYPKLLRELLDFFAPEAEDEVKGKKLAQAFSDAGISISQEIFVELYKKIYVNPK